MSFQTLHRNLLDLIRSIEDCREKRRILPCLTLLYSGIDIVASLEGQPTEGTRTAFQRWANNYLLVDGRLNCTTDDLYGARCGIIHTFSSKSDLSQKGRAREIVYSWGSGKAPDLQEAANRLGRRYVALQLEVLISVFKTGVATYLYDVQHDALRRKMVENNAGVWLNDVGTSLIQEFLRVVSPRSDV